MLNIGCHLSSANGYLAMGETAKTIDGNTFQFFTRNPRGGKAKKFVPQDAAALEDFTTAQFCPHFGPCSLYLKCLLSQGGNEKFRPRSNAGRLRKARAFAP